MDAATGEPVLVNGKPVEGEAGFTPQVPSGHVTVAFEFDGSALRGHDVVVFEALYLKGLFSARMRPLLIGYACVRTGTEAERAPEWPAS